MVARDQEFDSDPGGDKDLAKARLHQEEVARAMVWQPHKAKHRRRQGPPKYIVLFAAAVVVWGYNLIKFPSPYKYKGPTLDCKP